MARKKPKIDWFSPIKDTGLSLERYIATDRYGALKLFAGTPYERNLGELNEILVTHEDTKAEIHTAMSPAGWYLFNPKHHSQPVETLWLVHLNPLHHEGFRRSKKFYELLVQEGAFGVEAVIVNEYEDRAWGHEPHMEYSLIQETAHLTGRFPFTQDSVEGLFEVVLNWKHFPYDNSQMQKFFMEQLFG
tara:strand:+ start:8040 stop:8606 length:567 start_codon:yes stop_codon:yes gene_type:complete